MTKAQIWTGLSLVLALCSYSFSVLAKEQEMPDRWTPERMMQVKRIGAVQVSPDGKRVAYTVREAVMDGDKSEYLTHIFLANADGSETRQLTRGEKSCDDPQWSPAGETIAFISGRVGKENLWLISVDGGEAAQLTEMKSDVSTFRWSPDGKRLAFTAIEPPTEQEERRTKQKNDA